MAKRKDIYRNLGANERALLERIPIPPFRRLAANAVRLKMSLQFTGWLQYMIPLVPVLLFSLLGGVAQLLHLNFVSIPFFILGGGVLVIDLMDVITVKFRIHFPESLPPPPEVSDMFDLIMARESCRSFQIQKLTDAHRNYLLQSMAYHGNQPTLGKSRIRFEYISAPLTVWPTVNASEFIIAIAPKEYDRIAIIDIGRALEKVVIEATRMGIATCWIGPGADQRSMAKHLGDLFDPAKDHIICVCAVGYKSKYIPVFIRFFSRLVKRRLPLEKLFFTDPRLTRALDLSASKVARFGRCFEICRWAPSSYNGQTTRMVVRMDESNNPMGFDFYAVTQSRYYAPVALGIWCAHWELGCKALAMEGHFSVLTSEERRSIDDRSAEDLPVYDLSWFARTL